MLTLQQSLVADGVDEPRLIAPHWAACVMQSIRRAAASAAWPRERTARCSGAVVVIEITASCIKVRQLRRCDVGASGEERSSWKLPGVEQ